MLLGVLRAPSGSMVEARGIFRGKLAKNFPPLQTPILHSSGTQKDNIRDEEEESFNFVF